jgi:hypothetical protein
MDQSLPSSLFERNEPQNGVPDLDLVVVGQHMSCTKTLPPSGHPEERAIGRTQVEVRKSAVTELDLSVPRRYAGIG